MTSFDNDMDHSFWGSKDVEWSASHSIGASGGMVILWKKDSIFVNYSFIGRGFIGINFLWKGDIYNLVNVYAPSNAVERRVLWSSLVDRRNKSGAGEWFVAGDFNEVSSREERKGVRDNYSGRNMEDFMRFIDDMELIDLPCVGKKFTWFKGDGTVMSRIDRFLVSSKIIDEWKVIDQRVGARDISDHCHIWLNVGNIDWGPKPFRFNNAWFHHDGFLPFLEEEWNKLKFEGRGDFILYEKLKGLKASIRTWNRQVFGWIDLQVSEKVDNLNALDSLLAEHHGEDIKSMVDDRHNASKDIWNSLKMKESMLRLKSRQLWLKEGDKNSSYFHNSLKERRRRNAITVVTDQNGSVDGVADVKRVVKDHFEDFYKEKNRSRPTPVGLDFRKLREEDRTWIERPFSEEEIKVAVWDCNGNKSAGPDGRCISDGVLLINEVLDLENREKRSCLALKVDFEKAYGSVNWEFLRTMLNQFGFGKRWVSSMECCIFNSHFSILINGSTTKDFKVERGLRQGDPISPFLFVLVTEALSRLMKRAVSLGQYRSFNVYEELDVNLVQFADDTILVAEGVSDNIWWMKSILRGFEMMSGLRINFHKSKIYGVHVGDWIMEAASNFLACDIDYLPFKYLGIKIGDSPRKLNMWKDLIKHLKDKGGLGIKDVKYMNMALLNKWKWRILNENEPVRSSLLAFRYGNPRLKIMVGNNSVLSNKDSIWWRDLILCDQSVALPNRFAGSILSKVANGRVTSFCVEEAGQWQGSDWMWNLDGIVESGTTDVQNLCTEMMEMLDEFVLDRDAVDRFVWMKNGEGIFSVRSCYDSMATPNVTSIIPEDVLEALSHLWKSETPTKIQHFG
ncbi:uncharacterized protein LOC131597999 [Vicia villosa]|uniref:uncharacterized protein LOC131597999 n=1 Tax=Vicia villosa TaxID=3911 RepID=UPI00273B932D|nr:uncharacterized protein LOC131597999 [Vicia villosa]